MICNISKVKVDLICLGGGGVIICEKCGNEKEKKQTMRQAEQQKQRDQGESQGVGASTQIVNQFYDNSTIKYHQNTVINKLEDVGFSI